MCAYYPRGPIGFIKILLTKVMWSIANLVVAESRSPMAMNESFNLCSIVFVNVYNCLRSLELSTSVYAKT